MICVGYTDLPSRLPTQSSTLYSNNLSKFLLSMGPFTGHKEHFFIDHKDDAVRGALILDNGELMWPAPPLKVGPPYPFLPFCQNVCVSEQMLCACVTDVTYLQG